MEVDPATPPVEDESLLRQQILAAERVFLDYGDGPSFYRRFNKQVFHRLCEDRELDTRGNKKELYARLGIWVHLFFSVHRGFDLIPT